MPIVKSMGIFLLRIASGLCLPPSNKEFLPDSYTAFKNKIGLTNEQGDYLTNSQEVVLAWPYKDCVLEGGQTKEDQKRDYLNIK